MPLFRDGQCPDLHRWSEPAQIAAFAACALFMNFVLGYTLSPLGYTDAVKVQEELLQEHGIVGTIIRVLLAPCYETIFGQWLPLLITRVFKKSPVVQIAWSSLWFGVMHLPNGPASFIQNIGVGWVLASCFVFCRQVNWVKAFRVTTLAHALHNGIVFTIFLLGVR